MNYNMINTSDSEIGGVKNVPRIKYISIQPSQIKQHLDTNQGLYASVAIGSLHRFTKLYAVSL